MKEALVSLKNYEALCEMGIEYDGYVWTEEGKIYHVMSLSKTIARPYPTASIRTYPWGLPQGRTFYDTIKVPVITEESLGSNDVLYDTNGNFITVIKANDPIKGEIKILKNVKKIPLIIAWNADNIKDYDIINIEDIILSPEAYSKIFTHILSIMMKDNLENIRNKTVSVELFGKKREKIGKYNLDDYHKEKISSRIDAYYSREQNAVAAILYYNIPENIHLYSTVWNVLNNLGAHEMLGHGTTGWWNDRHRTHHLPYLYQMGHPSWQNTTNKFKIDMQNRLNRYYSDYRGEEREDRDGITGKHQNLDNFNGLRSLGLYPKWDIFGNDSLKFNERLSKELQKKISMKNPYVE
jgi:hypothetical protein